MGRVLNNSKYAPLHFLEFVGIMGLAEAKDFKNTLEEKPCTKTQKKTIHTQKAKPR